MAHVPHGQGAWVDTTRVPALAGAVGEVLTDGKFRCTLMDHRGNPTDTPCGSEIKNEKSNIRSHLNKLHNPQSTYRLSNGDETIPCDRPRLDGRGWCTSLLKNRNSLVGHARKYHKLKGNSDSVTTPWEKLRVKQRVYYFDRIYLETRRRRNGGVFTPADEALNEQLEQEEFPNA
ncbi:hypothetical protein GGR55DRAFT_511758 [Xylaria sp. FL0064]|nr:hypothetical protein GGR55DRAFT_511758 [Xylaria sp. FL0064]